jgi:hypothetical protein
MNDGSAPLPATFSRHDLESAGFDGWASWEELAATDFGSVPSTPLVYVIYSDWGHDPTFLRTNPAGRFKGRDPSVPLAVLNANWVPGVSVLYIGKADRGRRRVKQFDRFGRGEPVGHWGGRLIWQIAEANRLLVAWREVPRSERARAYEKRLLEHFLVLHRARPFANLTG